MAEAKEACRVREILTSVRPLASEYYQLTGKPLGVTGEVAEYIAADLLGLELAPPRRLIGFLWQRYIRTELNPRGDICGRM
jgi:hypothetical protein